MCESLYQEHHTATRKGVWLFLKQHMVALAVCEMLCRQKYSWGVTNHTPLLFIIAADMSSAGPSSLALGLGTPVAWLQVFAHH